MRYFNFPVAVLPDGHGQVRRTLSLAVLNDRRRRAVKLRERELTLREVAAQCELLVPTVMTADRAYVSGGWAAVAVKPRGSKPGDGRQLSAQEEARIRRLICDRAPE